jgi:transcriptional regulator with XRE-family HTH domain
MNTLQERLSQAMKERCRARRGCNAELARACGIKEASISQLLSGDSKSMRADTAIRAARWLNVSVVWLVLGEGPARPELSPWDLQIAHALAKLQAEIRQPLEAAILAAAAKTDEMGPPVPDGRLQQLLPPVPGRRLTKA